MQINIDDELDTQLEEIAYMLGMDKEELIHRILSAFIKRYNETLGEILTEEIFW
jgi:predicted transcriptional regulator